MAATSVNGTYPNPVTLPAVSSDLDIAIQSTFDIGTVDVDKQAVLREVLASIEYHTAYTQEFDFDAFDSEYYMTEATGLPTAKPIYLPAYTLDNAVGIWGYLVALFITCEEGSCILLNNSRVPTPVTSTQHVPYPMNVGDFLLWADDNEPMEGIDEDGDNKQIVVKGIECSTVTGCRLRVHTFYKFMEVV
jgi:hypothetical protein